MPSDSRMALDTILLGSTGRYPSPEPATKPYPTRPKIHRSTTPRPDPWDLPYPATLIAQTSYSSSSAYSNASTASSCSEYCNSSLPMSTLSRNNSSASSSGAPSPITLDHGFFNSSQPRAHRCYEEIAAGLALTTMRTLKPSKPSPLSPIILLPTEMQAQLHFQIKSPHDHCATPPPTPHDSNGNRMYSCPLAALYRCDQHFSTSGHARRHSRRHTGERTSKCPECGQKFSRQDNMQQHRRTHRTGRDKKTKANYPASLRNPTVSRNVLIASNSAYSPASFSS